MDFFGGILDSLRGIGDDVGGFFDSAIGQAVAKGVQGGYKGNKNKKEIALDEGFYNTTLKYSPTPDNTPVPQSEDFTSLEREWLQRLHRFSGVGTNTEVKLGGN